MPLYRWNADNLEAVPPSTFEAEQLQEANLQRLLRDQPDVLEEGLFIISEEYSNWQDSYRSIDLLGLDRTGRLVVIELKRTQSGDHSELQAIRYAAMVSNMTLEQIIEAHREYLVRRGKDEDARVHILGHLGFSEEADAEIRTKDPRIILASAGFSKELSTSVLWLNDNGLDITCIRLRLYRSGGETLMDTDQIIPLPEATDYLVRVRQRENVERGQRGQVKTTQGSSVFSKRIDEMPDNDKPRLYSLLDWAQSLEEESLVRLYTRQGSQHTVLRLNLRTVFVRLVNIYISPNDYSIEFWPRVWNRYAPNSVSCLAEAISPALLRDGGTYLRDWSEALLDVVRDAYREANGLPTTPPPGNSPGSPAPAG